MFGRQLFFGFSLLALAGCSADPSSSGGRDGGRDSGGGSAGGDAAVGGADGSAAPFCDDADVDFICDYHETGGDSDSDGTPDHLDTDSDGDGFPDLVEAGDGDPSTPPRDTNGDGTPDFLDPSFPRPPPMDAGPADGSGIYDLGSGGDGGDVLPDLCPPEAMVGLGCLAELMEYASGLCNGLDDDCDGIVDDGCACTIGEVQRCFRGPPARRGVGACQDGMQRCVSAGEFGVWGECEGGIAPSAEACDDLDNDCNGCTDEVSGCMMPTGSCPGPDDPRVPEARPFTSYPLRGGDFYMGTDAVSWSWTVTGSPCDRMFLAQPGSPATSDNGMLSYRVTGSTSQDASVDFTLSGDYTVTLTVGKADGTTFTCTWIIHVRAPGLRVELCWDATGPTASALGGSLDIDLHLGRTGTTGRWFDATDCDYLSCKREGTLHAAWGYAASAIESCTGPGARGGFTGSCPNPRLDIDNIIETTEYVPENINLDNPRDGDQFRVMVHHYASSDRPARPLVNVYCGGELRATYGADPDFVTGFDQGGGRNGGSMWRVADVRTMVDGTGVTTGCEVTPLHPSGAMSGYAVTNDDSTY